MDMPGPCLEGARPEFHPSNSPSASYHCKQGDIKHNCEEEPLQLANANSLDILKMLGTQSDNTSAKANIEHDCFLTHRR